MTVIKNLLRPDDLILGLEEVGVITSYLLDPKTSTVGFSASTFMLTDAMYFFGCDIETVKTVREINKKTSKMITLRVLRTRQ